MLKGIPRIFFLLLVFSSFLFSGIFLSPTYALTDQEWLNSIGYPFDPGNDWCVVQGYNTTITHNNNLKYALDLSVNYKSPYYSTSDTIGKNIIAAADGYVRDYYNSKGFAVRVFKNNSKFGYAAEYAHIDTTNLNTMHPAVKAAYQYGQMGGFIKKGEVIGKVFDDYAPGNAYHVHFNLAYYNGSSYIPIPLVGGVWNLSANGTTNQYRFSCFRAPDPKPVKLPTLVCQSNGKCPVYRYYGTSQGHRYASNVSQKRYFDGVSGLVSEGLAFTVFNKAATGRVPIYRLQNISNGADFYTRSITERNSAINSGAYAYRGVGYYAFPTTSTSGIPVYRFYGARTQSHFYTISTTERDLLRQPGSGWAYEGVAFKALPKTTCNGALCAVFRMYHGSKQQHYYTRNFDSASKLLNSDSKWVSEDVGFYAYNRRLNTSLYPVYQVTRNSNGASFYTRSSSERNSLISSGLWTNAGVAFYAFASSGTGRVPVYRFYRSSSESHFYTTSSVERDLLRRTGSGWKYEGIVFYAKSSY